MGKRLLREYQHSDDVDFGEIVNLDELTDAEVREMVRDWMEPCFDRPFTFITRKDGEHLLIDLPGDFKIVEDGKVLSQR